MNQGQENTQGRSGVFVVDKPVGPTSHDVVARARRALRERRVGHAGTLDPLASGVLVVLAGEATKLATFLSADDKRYAAKVKLGVETDTLDGEGRVVREAPLHASLVNALARLRESGELVAELERVLALERARTMQVPPAFSAIHVDGARSHALARAGKAVPLAPRPVLVRRLELRASDDDDVLAFDLDVGKGYYVRSFARDVGELLGVPAHLASLRRVASGPFDLAHAIALDALAWDRALSPAEAASRAIGAAVLVDEAVALARAGKSLASLHFVEPPGAGTRAWLSREGVLVAIGQGDGEAFRVVRGFVA